MIHVVVPVYDEAADIEAAIAGIRERLLPYALPHRLVIVDDGSTDATAELCRNASRPGSPVEVLVHDHNRGPGAAFLTGFLHVLESADPLDLVITMEGDRTSDPAILARLLHRIWEEGDEIALASCYLYGGEVVEVKAHRIGLSHLANGLMKKTLGLTGLSTLSSFYRVYQVSALARIRDHYGDRFITSTGFECMVEVLHRAARLGLRISEVPMRLDGSKRAGRSKMRVIRTSLAYLRLTARAMLGRL